MLGVVVVLIVAQTVLVGVLLWRFRRVERAATDVAAQQLVLNGRLLVLEEQVADNGRR